MIAGRAVAAAQPCRFAPQYAAAVPPAAAAPPDAEAAPARVPTGRRCRVAGPPPRLRLAAVRRRRPSPSSGTRASARCGSSTDPAQRPQRVDWGLLVRSGRDTRRCCRALAPASSIQIPRARSAVELHPAAVLCARALETWFGDLSATTRRLALRREVRARPVPREGTRPFLARSGKSLSSPAAHASLPLPRRRIRS